MYENQKPFLGAAFVIDTSGSFRLGCLMTEIKGPSVPESWPLDIVIVTGSVITMGDAWMKWGHRQRVGVVLAGRRDCTPHGAVKKKRGKKDNVLKL